MFSFLVALALSVSPAAAQTRWDSGGGRDRDNSVSGSGSYWQGSNWLAPVAEQRPEWTLGIRGENTQVGVQIREVSPGSAASRARIEPGDIIVSVGGFQVGMVDGRLYDISEEINRRANTAGAVSMVLQDHRSLGLGAVDVQLDSRQQSLRGTLVYRQPTSMPADAIVTIQIENVTRPFYQVRNGQTSFRPTNLRGDIPFEIAYDPTYINSQDVYQVRAFVTSRQRTILDTPQPQRVITQGNPSDVRMQLVSQVGLATTGNTGTGGGVVSAGYPNYNQVDDQLIAMYRRYLNREPTRLELAALRMTPGIANRMSEMPLELMAAQEYFDAAGNNNAVWLETVFQEIVRRRPSQLELEQWMRRYSDLRFSRTELLRQLQSVVGN